MKPPLILLPLDGVTPLKLSCELLRAMWKKNIFRR